MTTPSVSIEDYLGAIYRLQSTGTDLLPLGVLQDFFGFSPISIHEMVKKLTQRGLAEYQPYKGVRLTSIGNETAEALVRRHRIWECFLANELEVPMDEAHQLAGDLEHAAPDWITERLFVHLGEPENCPHGSKIGESNPGSLEISLDKTEIDQDMIITRIYPEKESVLLFAREAGLHPGQKVKVLQKDAPHRKIVLDGCEVQISNDALSCIWGIKKND